ncbi:MAG: MucR family transcriptional regulator [Caulobacteraceae bacterium]
MSGNPDRLRELVSNVAAAYFSNSSVSPADIPSVLAQIAESLSAIGESSEANAFEAPARQRGKPTEAEIRNSIRRDGLISFEDGRVYKTLRRHLNKLGLTPSQYRAKWGLPHDYPLVAPSLSEFRSAMARQKQLGHLPKTPSPSPKPKDGRRSKASLAR